jgi:hypothetical protein
MNNSNYQGMESYDGSLAGRQLKDYNSTLQRNPEWQGIEYDWEVPDNQVIASPGGVSSVHHHYTKGFYGKGNMSSDIFAGQGERYTSGLYGNLYQTGHESSQAYYENPPPDRQYWNNLEPASYSYSQIQKPDLDPYMEMGKDLGDYETSLIDDYEKKNPINQYSENVENYTFDNESNISVGNNMYNDNDDFELISQENKYIAIPPDQNGGNSPVEQEDNKIVELSTDFCVGTKVKPWEQLLFLILVFVVVAFWADTALLFIRQRFHGGEDPSWEKGVLYSIIVTFLFGLLAWLAGYPVTTL